MLLIEKIQKDYGRFALILGVIVVILTFLFPYFLNLLGRENSNILRYLFFYALIFVLLLISFIFSIISIKKEKFNWKNIISFIIIIIYAIWAIWDLPILLKDENIRSMLTK